MKTSIALAFALVLISLAAQAQIVITSETFKAIAGIEMKSVDQTIIDPNINDKLLAIAAKSGTGQTWNISTFNYEPGDTSTTILIEGISSAPGSNDPRLANANYVTRHSYSSLPGETDWLFLSISDTDMLYHGVFSSTSEPQNIFFEPPFVVSKFPFSYGSSWETRITFKFDDSLIMPFEIYQDINTTIDGEGMLILPGGTSVPCLRLKQVSFAHADAPYDFFRDTSTSYSFIDASGKSLASLSLNHAGMMTSFQSTAKVAVQQPIIYSAVDPNVRTANEIVITASPNPAVDKLEIVYTPISAGQIELTMTNASGVVVRRIAKYVTATEQHEPLDITSLSTGVYLVHLEYNGGSAFTKVVVGP